MPLDHHEPAVLHADEDILAINKAAGLLAVEDGYDRDKPHARSLLEPDFGRLFIVHRLDKETSGVMVLARHARAHRELSIQFARQEAAKCYHALIAGSPPWEEITVNLPLRAGVGRRKRTIIDPQGGKPAQTALRVLKRFRDHTLVQAMPATGRTHQIRVHLHHLGFAILSDPLYGRGELSPHIPRLALHAHALTLRHPSTGTAISLKAPLPEDFKAALRACQGEVHLGKHTASQAGVR